MLGGTNSPAGTGPAALRQGTARAAVLALALALAGCGATITKHGHHFHENDLQQIQPGMSQEQVRMTLGSPATSASIGAGNAYYYISSTMSQAVFFAPSETDRQVVAVYFSQSGQVERVAQYGLKDGKVFDFISRKTASANTNEEGILSSLFRNLGKRGSLFGE